jgi:hypothetical protein
VIAARPELKPPGAGAAFGRALGHLGGVEEPDVVAASWSTRVSPATLLDRMQSRVHQETWALDDETLALAVAAVRADAVAAWDDLEREHEFERRFVLTVSRKGAVA